MDIKYLDMSSYDEVIRECRDISISKNKDYGCDTMLKFMEKGLIVRMNDKMERMINLIWNDSHAMVKDEKIEDTAKDLLNYAAYLVMMRRGRLWKRSKA